MTQPRAKRTKIVGVSRVRPQTSGNEFVSVLVPAAENILLRVRDAFNKEPGEPERHPDGIEGPEGGSRLIFVVEDQNWEV